MSPHPRPLASAAALLVALTALLLPGGCNPFASEDGDPTQVQPSGPLQVAALSQPVAWLATELGQGWVAVEAITPPGEDPPAFRPSGDDVAAVAKADLIVAVGAGYEAWTATAALPGERLVDTAKGLETITLPGVTHSHGGEGAHSHGGVDPHVFADPLLFLRQGEAVAHALAGARPEHADRYLENLATLKAALLMLHRDQEIALSKGRGLQLAASHPAFNYLARRYGLSIRSFDFDPETPPTPASLDAFAAFAAGVATPILLWESRPSDAVKAAFPAGTRHVYIDPLEQPWPGRGYDYLAQTRANIQTFDQLFSTLSTP